MNDLEIAMRFHRLPEELQRTLKALSSIWGGDRLRAAVRKYPAETDPSRPQGAEAALSAPDAHPLNPSETNHG